jgi:Zinc carboxypeptidase
MIRMLRWAMNKGRWSSTAEFMLGRTTLTLREWIGPAVVTYIATQLLEEATNAPIARLLANFTYSIIPALNMYQ